MVSAGPGGAAPGTGRVPGADADELSATVPFGIAFGIGKAAEVRSGAWARTVAAGRPSRADGGPSWAATHGTTAREQPRPNRIRFIDPPSGQ
jgi:hypothetical protein